MTTDNQTQIEMLRARVLAVARRHRWCAVLYGASRLVWQLGLPLLALLLAQMAWGLPFYLRAPIVPAALALALWWGWRRVVRPLVSRYTLTRAAMLVEAERPELQSRVVSALELAPRLSEVPPPFDPDLIEALIHYAQTSTAADDFRLVIDRRPAVRHLVIALITLLAWGACFAASPGRFRDACGSLVLAWTDVGDLIRQAGGARIEIQPLDKRAYLVGSDVTLHVAQKEFHRPSMTLLLRPAGGTGAWQRIPLSVADDGRAAHTVRQVKSSFEFYAVSGRLESPKVTAVVTERPRLTTLSVEYELPEYVRQASIVEPRSDGHLKVLYGSTVILTVEANKPLAAAQLTAPFLKAPEPFTVGGPYARGILRVSRDAWLKDPAATIRESYRLLLKDEYGYTNADADHDYRLDIVKDAPPVLQFTGLPHRSPEEEPHLLEDRLDSIALTVQGRDDYGMRKIVLHYRLEDLETGKILSENTRDRQFPLPKTDVTTLRLARLSELGAKVGDRIVFWAEAEDAYDLEPDKGPNRVRTPVYRLAVVTQEALFSDVRYKDTWSVPWYDRQKMATLSRRQIPERLAPGSEPAATVAPRLLDTPPLTDALRGGDRILAQDYFDSLNSGK